MKTLLLLATLFIGFNAYQALNQAVEQTPSQVTYLQTIGAIK